MAAASAGRAETALTRFGLGPRPGDLTRIANDPKGFVLGQLDDKSAPLISEKLPDTRAILIAEAEYLATPRQDGEDAAGRPSIEAYQRDVLARAGRSVETEQPYVERLVLFWSNFFTVGADKNGRARATVGAFEREVIRPHVLGRFADMLEAATKHPAMLTYLDNDRSIGPRSRRGRRSGEGLNENLARETLELHSLGVDGGYTQADVTALAAVLSGWRGSPSRGGPKSGFAFNPELHEPGAQTVLGRRYAAAGVRQGEAVLADLARAPATADHVARRLAAHFVADAAPPDVVAALAATFRASDGDLRAVAATLARSDAAWAPAPAKFLPPYDLVVAAHRLTGLAPSRPLFAAAVDRLGQPMWRPPSPKGWPDEDDAWAAPDGLIERLDWLVRIADAAPPVADVTALAEDALGGRLRPATREAVGRAESRAQALALLMASGEFQIR